MDTHQLHKLIDQTYSAFNRRDIDGAFATMAEDVRWPRASEGGMVVGKPEVRAYWRRQWAEFDPHVEVLEIIANISGSVDVRVHQLVRNLHGQVLADSQVWHSYTFRDGSIASMEVRDADGLAQTGVSPAFARHE